MPLTLVRLVFTISEEGGEIEGKKVELEQKILDKFPEFSADSLSVLINYPHRVVAKKGEAYVGVIVEAMPIDIEEVRARIEMVFSELFPNKTCKFTVGLHKDFPEK